MTYLVFCPEVEQTDPSSEQAASARAWSEINTENYRDLIDFISCRPNLAERIILAANAAVHGRLAHRITSVDRAVFMLGVERVSSITAQAVAS